MLSPELSTKEKDAEKLINTVHGQVLVMEALQIAILHFSSDRDKFASKLSELRLLHDYIFCPARKSK